NRSVLGELLGLGSDELAALEQSGILTSRLPSR
ncbi:MAG: hypothetical protein RLZ04_1625, partial [Actinomycetota bacterium]